jgi:hypothetical protein
MKGLPGRRAIRIIKLHGDVAEGVVTITPDEIEAALWPHRREYKSELTGDIVIVGYEFESDPINHVLMRTPARELWWVNREPPLRPISGQDAKLITGESGSPGEFFGQLALRLLRVTAPGPTMPSLLDQTQRSLESAPSSLSAPPSTDFSNEYDYDYAETTYLQDRIRRYQTELSGQELAALRGEVNAQRDAQIRYLREQISRLEDEFREADRRSAFPGAQPQLLNLLERTALASRWRPNDTPVRNYLHEQIETVKTEYANTAPNQDIISAAVSAICLLAERLSPEVVDPQLVSALAVYVPNIGRRGL